MATEEKEPLTYKAAGVDYDIMDPLKQMAQSKARETVHNLKAVGYEEIGASRGESAYIWEEPDKYGTLVIEGLGTKNIVTDKMREITGNTYHKEIAQDDVAMIVNDLIVVGARPLVVCAYFAAGNSEWFKDEKRMEDLTDGFRDACNLAGAVWGGGESPTLRDIITDGKADLAGAAVGEIKPKNRITLGDKLCAGDRIILIESSGIHANGLTLARAVADHLPDGYATRLSNGKLYGEALLTPTHIYAKLIQDLFEAGVDIHYMVNITGHGWRKLMRANRDFTYNIDILPEIPEELLLIQQVSGNDDEEMYGNFNMGAGFAIYVPKKDINTVRQISMQNHRLTALNAGCIKDGPKRVFIKPLKGLTFEGETLGVR